MLSGGLVVLLHASAREREREREEGGEGGRGGGEGGGRVDSKQMSAEGGLLSDVLELNSTPFVSECERKRECVIWNSCSKNPF